MSEAMKDEQHWVDICKEYDYVHKDMAKEIRRLRADKEHWEDGWVEVCKLKEAQANALAQAKISAYREVRDKLDKLRKVVDAAQIVLDKAWKIPNSAYGIDADAMMELCEALRDLDERKP